MTAEGEYDRASPTQVAAANLKRLQESLRTLEEFGKIVDQALGRELEALRYRAYTLERRDRDGRVGEREAGRGEAVRAVDGCELSGCTRLDHTSAPRPAGPTSSNFAKRLLSAANFWSALEPFDTGRRKQPFFLSSTIRPRSPGSPTPTAFISGRTIFR